MPDFTDPSPASGTAEPVELEAVWDRYRAALDARPSKGPWTEKGITALCDAVADIPALLDRLEVAERELDQWHENADDANETMFAYKSHAHLLGQQLDAEIAKVSTETARSMGEDRLAIAEAMIKFGWLGMNEALAERDALAAKLAAVRDALAGHPVCDVHPDDDPISCCWKRAVADVQTALDGSGS